MDKIINAPSQLLTLADLLVILLVKPFFTNITEQIINGYRKIEQILKQSLNLDEVYAR